jgi:hypothetical protein
MAEFGAFVLIMQLQIFESVHEKGNKNKVTLIVLKLLIPKGLFTY